MVWHIGATGGYSVFLALFPQAHRAVAVVVDTSRLRDTVRVAVGLLRTVCQGHLLQPRAPGG